MNTEPKHEQGHEPWPGTPGAQNGDSARLEEVIFAFNSYIELLGAEINDLMGLHIAHGNFTSKRVREGHDCRLRIENAIDAARGVQPAAQEGAPAAEHERFRRTGEHEEHDAPSPAPAAEQMRCPHCGSVLLWSDDRGAHCDGCDDFDPQAELPAQEKPETASAPGEWDDNKRAEVEARFDQYWIGKGDAQSAKQAARDAYFSAFHAALAELRQDWPLALTQASVTELQRQLAEAKESAREVVEGVIATFATVCKSYLSDLESAQAACKAKDEALREIQWKAELGFWEEGGCSECGHNEPQGHDADCLVGKALAIQPT